MVAHSKRSVADAAGDADQLDVRIRVRDIDLALLKAPGRKEACRRGRKRLLSCLGQSRGDPDKILLRNADLHSLPGVSVEEGGQGRASPRIAAQYDDLLIFLCLLHQDFTDDFPVRYLIH